MSAFGAELRKFESLIGYTFNKKSLLIESLTHKSFSVDSNKQEVFNERLEFLGDSILNFVIAEELLRRYPQTNEGVLSKKRASLVNLSKLAELTLPWQLEQYMRFGPGEIKQGNHKNTRIHGSFLEALIAAIYLDAGMDFCRSWLLNRFSEEDFIVDPTDGYMDDYKSRLQELMQRKRMGTPLYETLLISGPSHKPLFLVSLIVNGVEKSRGEGGTKKSAEQIAAQLYLNDLMKE